MTGDETDLLADAIEEICAQQQEAAPAVPGRAGTAEALARDLWKTLEELGYTLVSVPESFGGSGGTLQQAAAVTRGAARKGVAVPLAETMWLAGWLLASSQQQVPTGPMTAALGDPTEVALTRTGRAWHIDGVLSRVPWADSVDLLVALVPGGSDGPFVVRLAPQRAELRPGQNVAGEPRPDVVCRNLHVPDDDVVPAGPGVSAEAFGNRAVLSRVIALAGGCEEVLRIAMLHAKQREQFGRPLARFQAVQHLLAQAAAETTAVVVSAQAALLALEHTSYQQASFAIAAAKAGAAESAGAVAERAHQVLGALGVTAEHPLHRSTRRLWAWRDEYGNERRHALDIGRRVLQGDAWDLIIGMPASASDADAWAGHTAAESGVVDE